MCTLCCLFIISSSGLIEICCCFHLGQSTPFLVLLLLSPPTFILVTVQDSVKTLPQETLPLFTTTILPHLTLVTLFIYSSSKIPLHFLPPFFSLKHVKILLLIIPIRSTAQARHIVLVGGITITSFQIECVLLLAQNMRNVP